MKWEGGESAAQTEPTQERGREARSTGLGAEAHSLGKGLRSTAVESCCRAAGGVSSLPDQAQAALSQKEGHCEPGARCEEPGDYQVEGTALSSQPSGLLSEVVLSGGTLRPYV